MLLYLPIHLKFYSWSDYIISFYLETLGTIKKQLLAIAFGFYKTASFHVSISFRIKPACKICPFQSITHINTILSYGDMGAMPFSAIFWRHFAPKAGGWNLSLWMIEVFVERIKLSWCVVIVINHLAKRFLLDFEFMVFICMI